MQLCPLCKKINEDNIEKCIHCKSSIEGNLNFVKNRIISHHSDRYIKISLIGIGGFSEVYRAFDKNKKIWVALKFLKKEYLDDKKIISLFEREASLLPKKGNENLISIYDSFIYSPYFYFVMEFMDGVDLGRWEESRKEISLVEIKSIMLQICNGLEFIHHLGYVHSDLKPSNIIINPVTMKLKIMDFGLAHESGNEYILDSNEKAGTINYISPEQKKGDKKLFSTSDIYSFGVILYELLTGILPIFGENNSVLKSSSIINFVKNNSVLNILEANLSHEELTIISELDKLIEDCLEYDKEVREKNILKIKKKIEEIIPYDCDIILHRSSKIKRKSKISISSLTTIDEFEMTAITALSNETGITFVDETEKSEIIEIKADSDLHKSDESYETNIKNNEKFEIGESKKVIIGNLALDFVWCPSGSFFMGSEKGSSDERPVHKVVISKGFWLGKYLITQRQWEKFMGYNPSIFKGGLLPVYNISYRECEEFIDKLNNLSRRCNFAIPTEAEWEYGCRSGTNSEYYWGDYMNDEYCWYLKNSNGRIQPIGQKKPNNWGLYDMCGNILEWASDWYDEYYYSKSPEIDPKGFEDGIIKVRRGGAWFCYENLCRCSDRFRYSEDCKQFLSGLRILMRIKE